MDNHVHFILYGTKEDCLKFMADYRALTEMWLVRHGEKGDAGKNWKYDAWPIKNNDDLKEKIIYALLRPINSLSQRKRNGANIGQLARLVHINIMDLKQILR